MITFAPGGNSDSFGKRKFPEQLPEYLASMGLNGYEVECGRGVRISDKTYELLPKLAEENGIYLTLHTPYFISLSSEKEETRLKSVDYILESAQAAHRLGIRKLVVHSGSCSKMTREAATELAKDTLTRAQKALDEAGLGEIILCPETMGKINQLGTLSEVIELCGVDERFLPCVDFGHLNARTLGGIKSEADYAAILDEIEDKLGHERLKHFHVHFSKIMYAFENGTALFYGVRFEKLHDISSELQPDREDIDRCEVLKVTGDKLEIKQDKAFDELKEQYRAAQAEGVRESMEEEVTALCSQYTAALHESIKGRFGDQVDFVDSIEDHRDKNWYALKVTTDQTVKEIAANMLMLTTVMNKTSAIGERAGQHLLDEA